MNKEVNAAVYKLQLSLLDGVDNEGQLLAAGTIMSQNDYNDVVTERSIAKLCGYPLCCNPLPSDRPQRKSRYRISLKEHKVYDTHETDMFCSTACGVSSKAFSASLQEERTSVLSSKIDKITKLFNGFDIKEKEETKAGDVVAGPSDAIEGYITQPRAKPSIKKKVSFKEGDKVKPTKQNGNQSLIFNDMDFMSTIITNEEYSVSKLPPCDSTEIAANSKPEELKGKEGSKNLKDQCINVESFDKGSASTNTASNSKLEGLKGKGGSKNLEDECIKVESYDKGAGLMGTASNSKLEKLVGKGGSKSLEDQSIKVKSYDRSAASTEKREKSETVSSSEQTVSEISTAEAENGTSLEEGGASSSTNLKSSLKSSDSNKLGRSVTWADNLSGGDLCEFDEMGNNSDKYDLNDDQMVRIASAEACAMALMEAVDAVESGNYLDIHDAVSEAGIIVLPPHDVDGGESNEDVAKDQTGEVPVCKPGIPKSELFDPEDLWYDSPPDGFSLTLSPFATMWMAIFGWVTSSSLAYIYGKDESFHEDYLSVNGREYPRKIVLRDGRSEEIKQTIAGCLSRVCPELVADLRLPLPLSDLEKALGQLLETMSFMDALPAFRMKQWKVIALLFMDALSACRIPPLTQHVTNRTMLLRKVLDSAQISAEEYELMKDFMIPLGRVPQFSMQSGA